MDILAQALRRAVAGRKASGLEVEHERINQLDKWLPSEEEQQLLADKWTELLRRHKGAPPLRPVQGYILEACHRAAQLGDPIGFLGNVGVGKGKTLAFLNMPRVFGAKNAVILIPPEMRTQYDLDYYEWAKHYDIDGVTVVKYSQLSRPNGTDLLRRLAPDLILADECQALRHASAARTKRFIRYMKENPNCRFAAMSGTLSTNRLEDYAHLSEIALRQYSPLPLEDNTLKQWSAVLSAEGEPDNAAWQAMSHVVRNNGRPRWTAPTVKDAGPRQRKEAREAFAYRFASAPGVVATVSSSTDIPLRLTAVRPPLNDLCNKALADLHAKYELPDGSPVVDGLHFHRACAQLSLGFYYVWDWPGEPDYDWMDARSDWHSSVRWYLKSYSREGVDSPFLVENYVRSCWSQGKQVSDRLDEGLRGWDVERHKDPPPVKAIWLDFNPVVWAVKWAKERERAFLWFQSRAVGEALQNWGIPVFWEGTPDPGTTPVCALSMAVYHKGRNFQAWNDQLILEPTSNAAMWEQLLGRCHRAGQKQDHVNAEVYYHTWPLHLAMGKAFGRSKYIQQTSSQPQKLLLADKRGFRTILENPYEA